MRPHYAGAREWRARHPLSSAVRRKVTRTYLACFYCGAWPTRSRRGWDSVRLEVDHLVPVAQGGTNEPNNLVMACESCNRSKQEKAVAAWVTEIHTKRIRPWAVSARTRNMKD